MDKDDRVLKVLVIDDEEIFRDRITLQLQSLESSLCLRWEFDYAESQQGAEKKLSENKYTFIVLDLALPYKDGGKSTEITYGERVAEFNRDKVRGKKQGVLLLSSHAEVYDSLKYKEDDLITVAIEKTKLNPVNLKAAVEWIILECAEKYSLTSDGRIRITSGTFRLYPEKLTLLVKGHNGEILIGNRINHPNKTFNQSYYFINALSNGKMKALERDEMIPILKNIPELDPKKIKDRKPTGLRFAFHKKVTEKVEKATNEYTLHHQDLLISEECFGLTDGFTIEKMSK